MVFIPEQMHIYVGDNEIDGRWNTLAGSFLFCSQQTLITLNSALASMLADLDLVK